jgi:biopolymer transport protein ExbB
MLHALAQISYWQLTLDGGLTNLFIFLLSIVAVATIIERCVNLRGERIVSRNLIDRIQQRWTVDSAAEVERFCRQRRSVFARVAGFVSANRNQDYASLSTAASDLASVEVRRHIQRIYPLALVATLTPLAGLFGTVLGMIETFHAVAEVGNASNIGLLASGIYKALSTTAAGLIVAIPTLAFYHYLRIRIRSATLLLEEGVNELLNRQILRGAK